MVRLIQSPTSHPGNLILNQLSRSCVEVFYDPSPHKVDRYEAKYGEPAQTRPKILRIDSENQSLTMWPRNTRESDRGFLGPKYEKVRSITLADAPLDLVYIDGDSDDENNGFVAPYFGSTEVMQRSILDEDIAHVPTTPTDVMAILEGLPSGFTKDYDYGLGLAFKYRFIVEAVESLSDSSAVTISRYTETQINAAAREFLLSFTDFEKARKSINNASNLANSAIRSVNRARVTNLLASRVGGPSVAVSMGRHPLRKRFTEVAQGGMGLTDSERDELISVFSDNAETIAKQQPVSIGKLRNDIELVTLGQLIERLAAKIDQADDESMWQEFLSENPSSWAWRLGTQ